MPGTILQSPSGTMTCTEHTWHSQNSTLCILGITSTCSCHGEGTTPTQAKGKNHPKSGSAGPPTLIKLNTFCVILISHKVKIHQQPERSRRNLRIKGILFPLPLWYFPFWITLKLFYLNLQKKKKRLIGVGSVLKITKTKGEKFGSQCRKRKFKISPRYYFGKVTFATALKFAWSSGQLNIIFTLYYIIVFFRQIYRHIPVHKCNFLA